MKWLPSVIHAVDIDLINSGRDAISNSLVSIISYDLLAKVQKDVAKKQFQVLIVVSVMLYVVFIQLATLMVVFFSC